MWPFSGKDSTCEPLERIKLHTIKTNLQKITITTTTTTKEQHFKFWTCQRRQQTNYGGRWRGARGGLSDCTTCCCCWRCVSLCMDRVSWRRYIPLLYFFLFIVVFLSVISLVENLNYDLIVWLNVTFRRKSYFFHGQRFAKDGCPHI